MDGKQRDLAKCPSITDNTDMNLNLSLSLIRFVFLFQDTGYTHVHFNVRFLRVHVAVVVSGITLDVAHVVRLRHAVHQVAIQLIGVTQNLRWYDRSVAAECLKCNIPLKSD